MLKLLLTCSPVATAARAFPVRQPVTAEQIQSASTTRLELRSSDRDRATAALRLWREPVDRLWRDPLLRVAGALLLLLALPYFLPGVASDWKARYAYFFDAPLLILTIVACGYAAARGLAAAGERRFWGLLSLAFSCWLMVRAFEAVAPRLVDDVQAHLIQDLLYLGYYLFFVLALERRPHQWDRDPRQRLIREHEAAGAILFCFGLLVYFSVIPSALHPSSFLSFVPSVLLYVVLDSYLVLRAIALRADTDDPEWRQIYSLLILATGLFLALDGLDLMTRIEGMPSFAAGSPLEILWLLPSLPMIATARLGAWRRGGAAINRGSSRDPFALVWRGRLVYYALGLPLIHLLAEVGGWIDDETRAARELCVLASLVILTGLAVLYDRRLTAQHRALQQDHRRLREQLEISQRMMAVRRLAGGVAHDFNNMLTVIRGHAELLLSKLDPRDDRRQDTERISQAATRAAALTAQLLAMSRKPRGTEESFCPADTVAEARPMLERLAGADLELRLELPSDPGYVYGDRAAFEDALVNLVMNARDATRAGGWIAIRTGDAELRGQAAEAQGLRPGRYGSIEVSDSGTGMDEETRSHVFEPFFTTKENGTGLGLSMVYSFATEAGGTVRVVSRPGLGTTFTLLLPEGPARERDETGPILVESQVRGTETVLVAEDEEAVREMVAQTLTTAGFSVLEAANGREALRIIEAGTDVDVVLTDVVMPELGGGVLAEHLHQRLPGLPFVFMTGYADDKLNGLGKWARRAPLLTKPFTGDELLQALRRALQSAPRTGS